jgi:SAM domain (Sterile alpha motif)
MDVVVWLRSLGLQRYEAAFRDNEIDERVLPGPTQEDLKNRRWPNRSPPDALGSNRNAARRHG